jgi:hypothetical protein
MDAKPNNVDYLPIWKFGATPEERLSEIAAIARKHPERFSKMVFLYVEELPDGFTISRRHAFNASTYELLGILQEAAHNILERT